MYYKQALNTLCYMRNVCVAQTARAHQTAVSMTVPHLRQVTNYLCYVTIWAIHIFFHKLIWSCAYLCHMPMVSYFLKQNLLLYIL